jgi:hypothetical protein
VVSNKPKLAEGQSLQVEVLEERKKKRLDAREGVADNMAVEVSPE